MKLTKNQKILAGVGALAGILLLTQSDEQAYGGGSGAFGGGFGGDGSIGETGVSGVSDSGTPYQFNFPTPDTSWVSSFMAPSASGSVMPESSPVITPKKESTAMISTSSGTSGSSGGLTSSLAQIFGTPSQRVDERGDAITSPSGGGSGAIKGESLGTKVINAVKDAFAAEKDPANQTPTGASTSISSPTVAVPKKLVESSQAAASIAEAGYGQTLFSPTKSSSSSKSSSVVKVVSSEPKKSEPKKSWTLAEVKAGKNRR